MEDFLRMNDAKSISFDIMGWIKQDLADHHKLYSKVKEASDAAWRIWPKVGRSPPKGWSPRVLTEWTEEYSRLTRKLETAHAAHYIICNAIEAYVQQQAKHALGQGQFGHSGKPATKPAKPSKMELGEAYILATRAIHTHRASFLKLKPQEKRIKLVATAKTLATLKATKVRAYNRLRKISAPKLTQECKFLSNWKTPAGGLHTLLQTSVMEYSFKTASQSCPPHKGSQALQLPFQLLWPPDRLRVNLKIQALHGTSANTRERKGSSNLHAVQRQIQGLQRVQSQSNRYGLKVTHYTAAPTQGPARPAPEPDPFRPVVKNKTRQKSAKKSRPISFRPAPDPDPPLDPDPDPDPSKQRRLG